MSNRSSHFKRRVQTPPSAPAGVSGSRALPALQSTAAQRQDGEGVWSSTLNPHAFIPRFLPGSFGGGA